MEVSSTITVSVPENSPSFDEMPMERSWMLLSLEMMDVMLFTMPMSSFPTPVSVMG